MTTIQSNKQYQDQIYQGVNLGKIFLEASSFIDCHFERCSLLEAQLHSCRFQRCSFSNCDLSLVDIEGCLFASVTFEGSKLIGIDWTKSLIGQPSLGNPLVFKHSILNHGTFIGLQLQGLRMLDCVVHEVDFRQADLSRASFSGTDLKDSLFLDTILEGADLRTASNYQIDPVKNSLSEAHFSLPEAMGLLFALDIHLDENDDGA